MIRLGICTSIDNAPVMREIGYDYLELNMTQVAQMREEDFAALRARTFTALRAPEESGLSHPRLRRGLHPPALTGHIVPPRGRTRGYSSRARRAT